jgi:sugar phosphate isomerase/epimerase
MITRRTFLALGATAAVTAAFGPRSASAKQIERVGLQLYTVRDAMAKDVDGTLEQVAKIGYKEVEFAGYFGKTPAEIKAKLATLGLTSPSTHVQLMHVRDKWPETLDTAAAAGHTWVVLAWLAPNERGGLEEYKKLADLLNTAGEAARKHDLRLAYHNHDFEFAPSGGAVPYEAMLTGTDPKFVEFEMDLYWVTKAGHDPVELFTKHPGRFPLLHVKDMDTTPAGGFAEVGRGKIDFKRIFAKADTGGAKHFYVEQDQTPGSPFDSIKISFDYLRDLKY